MQAETYTRLGTGAQRVIKDKLSDKIRSSKICGCHFTGNFFLIFIQFYRRVFTCVRNGLANNEFD